MSGRDSAAYKFPNPLGRLCCCSKWHGEGVVKLYSSYRLAPPEGSANLGVHFFFFYLKHAKMIGNKGIARPGTWLCVYI